MKLEGGASAATRDWAEALGALRRLLTLEDCPQEHLYDAYLRVARDVFQLPTGVVGSIDEGTFHFLRVMSDVPVPFREGTSRPIGSLFASDAVRAGSSLLCHHIARHPTLNGHPLHREGRFEVYAGVPIRVGTRIFGVMSLLGPTPRIEPFRRDDHAFLELLADTLGRAIERRQLEDQRRVAEQERREADMLFGTAFANAPIGMVLRGLDGHFLRANAAACRFLGFSEDELKRSDFQSITYGPDLCADLEQTEALLTGAAADYQIEKRYVRSNGEVVWAQLNVALVRFEDGSPRCFIAQIQDINQRRILAAELDLRRQELEEANSRLLTLATLDPLTTTLNRRALRQRLDEEMEEATRDGTPLALIMVDVDHFKTYNDRHGHLKGDQALKVVAQCLKDSARQSDAVGRFGGEEFLILLPRTEETAARAVAERVRERIAFSKDLPWPLTVSAGVHVFHPGDEKIPPDRPVAQADAALYKAKKHGRNRVEVA